MSTVPIHSFRRLQDLRQFMDRLAKHEAEGTSMEYPSYVGWSSSRRAFFIRSGASVYYWINERLVKE